MNIFFKGIFNSDDPEAKQVQNYIISILIIGGLAYKYLPSLT
jgi:hypothetical protein